MSRVSLALLSLALLWVGNILEVGLKRDLTVSGYSPDVLLVLILPIILLSTQATHIILGFLCGIFKGGMAGANMAHYILSFTFSYLLLGTFNQLKIQIGPLSFIVFIFCGSMLVKLFLLFLSPSQQIMLHLTDNLCTSVYNALLSLPVYALFVKLLKKKKIWQELRI